MAREVDIGAYSAYALAVKHGYKGTESEWVAAQEAARVAAEQAAENAAQTLASVGEQSAAAIEAVKGQEAQSIAAVEATGANQVEAVEAKGVEVLASIPEDYTKLTEDAKTHAPCIACDASGALVSMTDAAERAAVSVVSTINPAQPGTGDPSPENVRPISGFDAVTLTRTGKNLFGFRDYTYKANAYIDTCVNGVFRREVTTAHETSFAVNANAMLYIENPHIPAGTYTFTLTHMSGPTFHSPYLEVTLSDGSVVSLVNGVATTLPLDGTITVVRVTTWSYAAGDVLEFVMQLEAGTGTAYEPYSGVTLTADLPETVYGGTLDWTTGLLTVTHFAQTYDGTEAWNDPGNGMSYTLPNSVPGKVMADNEAFYHLCSHYKPARYRAPDVQADMSCYTLNGHTLCIKDTSVGTLDGLKAYLAAQAAAGMPVTVVYLLKPAYYTTHQLDPQTLEMLKGYNAVWSDTGDTSVVYIADTKMYIDNKFTALQSAILAMGANI